MNVFWIIAAVSLGIQSRRDQVQIENRCSFHRLRASTLTDVLEIPGLVMLVVELAKAFASLAMIIIYVSVVQTGNIAHCSRIVGVEVDA